MSGWSEWPAPAKLNLFLHIVGRRDDGYHLLQTVFQLVDWGDTLRLSPRDDGVVRRCNPLPGVDPEQDLCVRAARMLQAQAGAARGVDIDLIKRIPMGGGLGGGSSDAATALVALDLLWELNLGVERLAAIGLTLGADVPVFVRGYSAWGQGVGENLLAIDLPESWYVIVDPQESVPTAPLFQSRELTRNAAPTTIAGFLSGVRTSNAFEPVVRARYPKVARALDWLGEFGSARLSGSGGCAFVATPTREAAETIAVRCPEEFAARVARGVKRSPLLEAREKFSAGASPSW